MFSIDQWVGFTEYFNIGQRLVIDFTCIAPLCLWKLENLVNLCIRAIKHKVNTHDEYLTRSDNCVFTWS